MAKIKQEDGTYIDAPNAKTKIQLLTKADSSSTLLENVQLDLGEPLVNTKDKTLIIGTSDNQAANDANAIVLGNGRNVITDNNNNTITLKHFDGNSSTAGSSQNISITGGALSADSNGNVSIDTQYTIETQASGSGATITLDGAGNAESSSISITTKGAKTAVNSNNIEIDSTHDFNASIAENALTISHNDGETQTNVNICGSTEIAIEKDGDSAKLSATNYYVDVDNETTVFDSTPTLQLGTSENATIQGTADGIRIDQLVVSDLEVNPDTLPRAGTDKYGVVKVGNNLSVNDGVISGDYTTASNSQDGLMSYTDKEKLDNIAYGANNYSLPLAGSSLGGVKSGGDVNILDGIITVNDLNGKLDKIGTDNIIIKDVGDDKFKYLEFRYSNDNNDSESECSWRLGYDGTGSGNMNYFRIQSTKSSGTAAFTDALRIGMDNHDFVVEGPITATTVNGATIASTSFNGATITSAGAITAGKSGSYQRVTAGSFNAMSDARLKENFQPLALEKSILDLPIYRFDFIGGAKNQIGCKAQDLQEICPEIVNEGSDGYLSIQESKIVYLLLEEVKKLKREIADLKRG